MCSVIHKASLQVTFAWFWQLKAARNVPKVISAFSLFFENRFVSDLRPILFDNLYIIFALESFWLSFTKYISTSQR